MTERRCKLTIIGVIVGALLGLRMLGGIGVAIGGGANSVPAVMVGGIVGALVGYLLSTELGHRGR